MASIYVQIAAYRDPDLPNTIKDLITQSSKKHKIRIGVIDQFCAEDNYYDLEKDFGKIKQSHCTLDFESIDYKKTKGVCWVRHLLNKKYKRESYTLQLDSHHRFIKNWDTILIKMLKDLKKEGHNKPLLTTYCPAFIQKTGEKFHHATQMDFDRFTPEGALFFKSGLMPDWENKKLPVTSRFISGHMIFVAGSFCKEVPYDPYYLFHGEEINLTVRAYSHGYDLFHPHKPVVFHEYSRSHRPRKCWDDDPTWGSQNAKSHLRNRKFFEMDGEKKNIDFEDYDLGKVRTMKDYEEYSGVSMSRRSVQRYTLDLEYAPNPIKQTDPNFLDSFDPIFKHCIDVGFEQVPLSDYDFWVVAFHNEKGDTVFREDLGENQIKKIKSDPDGYCKIWKEFPCAKKPSYCIVWPHSKSKDWCDQIKIPL